MSEQFEDLEVYPVEASERGDNSFYLEHCSVAHKRPGYASCLKKIADRKNGRLSVSFADCSAAIGKKECPAMKLREKELKEGRALFYVNRDKLRAFGQYRDEMGMRRLASMVEGDTKPGKGKPSRAIKPSTPAPLTDTGDYAAAINRVMSEEAKKVEAPVAKPAPPAAKPTAATPAQPPMQAGLSLIEMARLRMAASAA